MEMGGYMGWLELVGSETDGEGGSVESEVERAIREVNDPREGEDFEGARKSVKGN